MLVIGLTGGIGTGKSTVSSFLRQMGLPVIDADKIAREVVNKDNKVLKSIVDKFGKDIWLNDGTLNRRLLGEIVFNNKEKLKILDLITHPAIKKEIIRQLSFYETNNESCCIIDVPLLIESGFTDLVDKIILIYTDCDTQIKRIMERDGLSINQITGRISSQMSFEEKSKYADYIIDNSNDFESTRVQLLKVLKEIIYPEEGND